METHGQPTSEWVPRLLDLPALLAKRSYFLLGPRQTGKTALVLRTLGAARVYDMLDTAVYLALSQHPERIGQELAPGDRLVVIDEIQRLPTLLNEVHRLIESRGIRFLLTGSSGRKLRRGGVNLLGGRARIQYLYPLTSAELGPRFDLARAVARGLLPSIYFSEDPQADLQAYAGLYLQQEVVAEGATRNVPAFSRFLKVAAHCNGTIVNFTNVASDAQVARTTVYEYFEILKDTLVLHEVPAWRKTVKRKPLASSKYYFFDVGVVGCLQGRTFRPGTPEFGEAFETLLLHELVSYRDYVSRQPLSYWRSTSGFEVDFILGDHTAVEVKAKETVSPQDLKPLGALVEEKRLKRYLCVSLEPRTRKVGEVTVLPYRTFLQGLWAGEYR
ncbi:MAG: ATP-binding protein [candidate division NC10 bacterium]|nr:ATP-binding protein [candidate division NC10 bacterium]